MVAFQSLVLVAALSAGGETVLLDFSSQYCGPCRSMTPVMQRLANDGYPVRVIDIEQQRELAAQYRITGVPCFVMLVNGREVDRITGATSYDRLAKAFQTAGFRSPGSAREVVRGQSPDRGGRHPETGPAPDLLRRMADREAGRAREQAAEETKYAEVASNAPGTELPPAPGQAAMNRQGPERHGGRSLQNGTPQERAMQATVRLTIDEGQYTSHGTGTIIDTHGEEALVLTCGHVFRDSKGKGAITVSFCGSGGPEPVPGHLIEYDLKRDVALVSIRPGAPVTAMQVASASYRPQSGQPVFSIGCDHGREARLAASRITAIDKYTGPANVEVAGAPAEGRSGGGLFSEEGLLIGVCNCADPADNEGIYAALPSVHWQLAQIGQQAIFERAESPLPTDLATGESKSAPPRMADEMPAPREITGVPSAASPRGNLFAAADSEIICIVRSKGNQGRSETFVLDRPSPELLDQLNREYHSAVPTKSLQAAKPAAKIVFRAQSPDK